MTTPWPARHRAAAALYYDDRGRAACSFPLHSDPAGFAAWLRDWTGARAGEWQRLGAAAWLPLGLAATPEPPGEPARLTLHLRYRPAPDDPTRVFNPLFGVDFVQWQGENDWAFTLAPVRPAMMRVDALCPTPERLGPAFAALLADIGQTYPETQLLRRRRALDARQSGRDARILADGARGTPLKEIAARYGLSVPRVKEILREQRRVAAAGPDTDRG